MTLRCHEILDTSGLKVKFLVFWFVTSGSVAGASANLVTSSKSVRYHIPPYEGTLGIVGPRKKVMHVVSAKISIVTP
jgi:hypothetical protein